MLSDQEITKAYKMWAQRNGFHSYEICLEPMMTLPPNRFASYPKIKKLFSQSLWDKVLQKVRNHPWFKACDQKKKSYALLYQAQKL